MTTYDYIREGDAIYRKSFAIIREEADLSSFSEDQADIAVRMIHACGLVEAAAHFRFSPDFVSKARGCAACRQADFLRRGDGRPWHHAGPAARRQSGNLHAS
jgi:precorrin-8X/cobalt-precorrin-8 methylmutase